MLFCNSCSMMPRASNLNSTIRAFPCVLWFSGTFSPWFVHLKGSQRGFASLDGVQGMGQLL